MMYDVILNGAENADGRRKNVKKGHLETTGHPRLLTVLCERNNEWPSTKT